MAVVDYNRSFSFLLGLLISYIFYLIYNVYVYVNQKTNSFLYFNFYLTIFYNKKLCLNQPQLINYAMILI